MSVTERDQLGIKSMLRTCRKGTGRLCGEEHHKGGEQKATWGECTSPAVFRAIKSTEIRQIRSFHGSQGGRGRCSGIKGGDQTVSQTH